MQYNDMRGRSMRSRASRIHNFQTDEVRSWCGVEYVRFQFEKYPPHVRDLKKYAWKPLVIAEQLSRFDAFFYVDSSVRPLKADFSVFSAAVATGMLEPFLMFTPTDHSILAATHPGKRPAEVHSRVHPVPLMG